VVAVAAAAASVSLEPASELGTDPEDESDDEVVFFAAIVLSFVAALALTFFVLTATGSLTLSVSEVIAGTGAVVAAESVTALMSGAAEDD
jgi:hypothetical protein